jgi:hypothetical protein
MLETVLVLSQSEFSMSMSVRRAGRGALTIVVFAGAALAASSAMAQLSSNKGGRETVPGGVEAKPGDDTDRTVPKSTLPSDVPAPGGVPPRTRSLGSPVPAPSTPPKSVPANPAAPDAKKSGDAK